MVKAIPPALLWMHPTRGNVGEERERQGNTGRSRWQIQAFLVNAPGFSQAASVSRLRNSHGQARGDGCLLARVAFAKGPKTSPAKSAQYDVRWDQMLGDTGLLSMMRARTAAAGASPPRRTHTR